MSGAPTTFFNIDFPSYVYQPFPRLVTAPDGKRVMVHSAAEERQIMAVAAPKIAQTAALSVSPTKISTPVEAAPASPDDDKAIWIQMAEEKGVKIDKRWNIAKIKAAVEGA